MLEGPFWAPVLYQHAIVGRDTFGTNRAITLNIPTELRTALKSGKVIPFIGAGVSMAVKHRKTLEPLFPSWKELLERATTTIRVDKPHKANMIDALLHEGRFLEAAREAEDGLGKSRWPDFLREQFKVKRDEIDEESLRLAKAIWRLGSNLIITTNYDNVVRWGHDRPDDVGQWKTTSKAEKAQSLRELPTEPTLWHLHGHVDDIENIVLTEEGYRRLYEASSDADSEHDVTREALKIHLASRPFLFIGYSLDDYPFVEQLQSLKNLFGGYSAPHFALLQEAEIESFSAKELGVTAVSYMSHGEPLLELLAELASIASQEDSSAPNTEATDSGGAACTVTTPPDVADFSPQKPAWNMPYPKKGDNVVGRQEALDRVRKQLLEGKRTVIGQTAAFQGLGGLGKTQMAIEYAWEYRDTYPAGVIWLHADQDLPPQLSAMAKKSEWVSPQSDSKTTYDIALHRTRNFEDGLIVFDNLENSTFIHEYLPNSGVKAHVLVTSREPQKDFVSVDLELLSADQAEKMLVQESGRLPQSDIECAAVNEIVKLLDGLPLALELVGAYMANSKIISWVQYEQLLKDSITKAFEIAGKRHGGSFTRHETDIFATLRLSEALIEDTPGLLEILRLLAWSGSASMGIDLVRTMLENISEAELVDALNVGVNLRILKQEDNDHYALHRLVRHVQREEFCLEEHDDWAETRVTRLGNWFEQHRQDVMELSVFEAEIDHLRIWLEQFAKHNSVQKARLLWLQAYPPFHRGQYEQSKAWLELARADLESSEHGNSEVLAHVLNDLGTIMSHLGNESLALSYMKDSLKFRLAHFGERHQDTAFSLNNIGASYSRLGKQNEALDYEQRALTIQIDLLGESHADTALSLSHIGNSYLILNDLENALAYQERALRIRQRILGSQHPQTAESLDCVGAIHQHMGENDIAMEFKTKALEARRQVLGNLHPYTARSLHSIGSTHSSLGNNEKSLGYHMNALQIREKVFGESHPETAISMLAVGACHNNMNDHIRALEYRIRGYTVRRNELGEQHPETAKALNLVGVTHCSLGDFKKAAQCALEAFETLDTALGLNHHLTQQCLTNCIVAYANDGRGRSKGLPLLNRALKNTTLDNTAYKKLKKLRDGILKRRKF